MRPVLGLALCAAVLSVSGWADASMRCGGQLLQQGDYAWELERACGEPDVREPVRTVVTGTGEHATVQERWFYNPGPQGLIRVVNVRDGRIAAISRGGRGYRDVPGGPCRAGELQSGMSRLDLLARCGEPARQQVLSPSGGGQPGVTVRPREQWVYEFGIGQLMRVVTLEAGRVTRVEAGPRE